MILKIPTREVLTKDTSVTAQRSIDRPNQHKRTGNNEHKSSNLKEKPSFRNKENSFNESLKNISDSYNEYQRNGENVKRNSEIHAEIDKNVLVSEVENCVEQQNAIATESTMQNEIMIINQLSVKKAIALIQDSLLRISERLNLQSPSLSILQEFEMGNSSDFIVTQLSEILYSLKTMTQLLENAVKDTISLDIKGIPVTPEMASDLEQFCRKEIFQLEIAFTIAGIGGKIAQEVAQKMNIPVPDGSIQQAIDPRSLTMPESHLQQIMGKEEQIRLVIERIASLVIDDKKPHFKKNAQSIVSLTNSNLSSAKPLMPPHTVDAQILRQLLHLTPAIQDTSTEVSEKNNINKPNPLSLGKTYLNTLMFTNQNFPETINSLKEITEDGNPIQNTLTHEHSTPLNSPQKTLILPGRALEESILLQVSQRMHGALKNGIHEVHLVLRPETLGEVRMTIHMENDVVMARINVENLSVKQIIESNLQNLKDSLEEQNLHAGSIDVHVNQGSKDNNQDDTEIAGDSSGIEETNTESEVSAHKQIVFGVNTGRFFGFNSIEFFA